MSKHRELFLPDLEVLKTIWRKKGGEKLRRGGAGMETNFYSKVVVAAY